MKTLHFLDDLGGLKAGLRPRIVVEFELESGQMLMSGLGSLTAVALEPVNGLVQRIDHSDEFSVKVLDRLPYIRL